MAILQYQALEAGDTTPFDRLHPGAVAEPLRIVELLERLQREEVALTRGMNRKIDPETAWIESLDDASIRLRTQDFELDSRSQIYFNFVLDGQPHFFSAPLLERKPSEVVVRTPTVVYLAERRDHVRRPPLDDDPTAVELWQADLAIAIGRIADLSPEGIAVDVADADAERLDGSFGLRFVDGRRAGELLHGQVHQRSPVARRDGWTRLGLGLSASKPGGRLDRQNLDSALPRTRLQRGHQRWKVISAGVQLAGQRLRERVLRRPSELPEVRVVTYKNREGESINAIVDSHGEPRNQTVVVIPPAWGRTKESLMPLSASIVAAFRRAGEPVAVIRFDGVRKRGESYNDPTCREPGTDHHRFTFSQGVRDIQATLDFVHDSPDFDPRANILVSFSAASIEARRSVASDPRIDGWISVVGASDVQSMMRIISGGVDYVLGIEQGISFGFQEILGIEVDMDHAGIDAHRHRLVYLEDARRDMEQIKVPVTWIHGKYDAWMDPARGLDALSRGATENRRFIEVPTGHMLKTSSEALETFQLVVSEIARISLGREIEPDLPDLARLELVRRAERNRLNAASPDLRAFWKDYLIGRDETLGIEMMTSITPYRDLMTKQVEALDLAAGDVVADVGSGTGAFPLHIVDQKAGVPARIIELDYVIQGLRRAQERLDSRALPASLAVDFVECNFDRNGRAPAIPLASGSVDAAIAALLISYVSDPSNLLAELSRILKPGGRLVVSSLRRDADMSRLYRDGVEELRAGRAREVLGKDSELRIDELARSYLNQASRLLDLEEVGTFRFWDPDELVALVSQAGFTEVSSRRSLGEPPQAVIVSARRR